MCMSVSEFKKNMIFFCIVTLWFVYFTGGKFVNPFYIDWIFPSDTETHWLGWQFYKNQSIFNFPIFKNTDYGLELGSSLVLNDSLAIMAIIFKPFSQFIPFEFQYFGIWTYICFILQGIVAMKIFSNFTDDLVAILLCGLLFTMLPPFLWRLHGHFGLLGHWLILFAFLLYLTSKELSLKYWTILIIISLLINAYISAMLIGIFIADLVKYKLLSSNYDIKKLTIIFSKFLGSLLLALLTFGYFMIGKGAGGKGFGKFNANLNSFFDPDQIWSITINNLSTPESGYEGFAFPGIGIFLAIVIALLTILFKNPQYKSLNLRIYYPIIIVSLVAYFFALSNNITLGQNIIYTYQVPDFFTFLTKTFRSSGRFVWILFYLIILGSLIFIFKSYTKRTLRIILILIVSLQFIDLHEAKEYFSTKFNNPTVYNGRSLKWASPMKDPFWELIGKNYKQINYVYTKNRPKDYFSISHFAAKNNMRINTGYFSRISKAGAKLVNQELRQAILNKKLDSASIYFIYDNELWLYINKNYKSSNFIIKELDNFRILALP
jgi:hypothetical protein